MSRPIINFQYLFEEVILKVFFYYWIVHFLIILLHSKHVKKLKSILVTTFHSSAQEYNIGKYIKLLPV